MNKGAIGMGAAFRKSIILMFSFFFYSSTASKIKKRITDIIKREYSIGELILNLHVINLRCTEATFMAAYCPLPTKTR